MIRGGSHSLRLLSPYPFFVKKASGPEVVDVDGNVFLDFWQGHYANILGHNPGFSDLETNGDEPAEESLHTGFEVETQVKLAELLLKQVGWKGHKVRFTTSGTLATMYAVMLAFGKTGRDEVLKIGGGWHGASPVLLKGIKFDPKLGFGRIESAGVPDAFARKIHTVRYNDSDDLARIFRKRGDKIACLILEPYLGAGGFLPATREFLQEARRLTARHGAVLIFDEIISGFRFAPTGVQRLAGIEPDVSTFGKVTRRRTCRGCRPGQGGDSGLHPVEARPPGTGSVLGRDLLGSPAVPPGRPADASPPHPRSGFDLSPDRGHGRAPAAGD
ncbi:MAG: aminotransferase class III-fold pyridoxal phosphate-dependent enzyme [Candidatus Moduliflexus flocculans]|nr:aminotransferase class III-fold pyridoxal phosphate-dependent enzyme [Candidatus Moduliflexus flocculans]